MKNLAIITGLELEVKTVKDAITKAKGDWPFFGVSGMGAPMADKVLQDAVNKGAKAVISFGLCGGLDPLLFSGQVILPDVLMDESGRLDNFIDEPWRQRLHDKLSSQFDIHTGPLISVSEPVTTSADKAQLFKKSGAVAVDMETAILARKAKELGLSFIALRIIHDVADQAIPVAFKDVIGKDGKISIRKLITGLIFHWPGTKAIRQMNDAAGLSRDAMAGVVTLALPDFCFLGDG